MVVMRACTDRRISSRTGWTASAAIGASGRIISDSIRDETTVLLYVQLLYGSRVFVGSP